MAGETPRDPLRFEDTLNGSSTGWTDEKHMLYISSLELSFVTKLYDGEVYSNGVFCWSPSEWRHNTHNDHKNTQVDQEHRGMIEADGAESRVSQAEHTESPSCDRDQDDRKAYYMDDDASTSDPRQEGIYYARRKSFGGSTTYLHWHGHSLAGTELSDQNFIDDETEVSEEQMRVCSNKRLKHTASSPAAPSASENPTKEAIHHVEADYSGSSSDFDIGEPASCKSHGSRRWSV